jgi:hypothetical protein
VVGTGSPPGNRTNTAGDTESAATTGSYTMSNTLATSAAWSIAAVEIKEAATIGSASQKRCTAGIFSKDVIAGLYQKEVD